MIFLHSAQDPLDLVSRELVLKAAATLRIIASVSSEAIGLSVSSKAIGLVPGATHSQELQREGPGWLQDLTPHHGRRPEPMRTGFCLRSENRGPGDPSRS